MQSTNIDFSSSELHTCTGCTAWVDMMRDKSFISLQEVIGEARKCWWQQVPVTGWLEAIQAHPRLGDDVAVQNKRMASTTAFQRATSAEQDKLLARGQEFSGRIKEWNMKYEAKFGHVFLLFANGKSPEQVLQCIKERFTNSPVSELKVAAQQEMLIIEDRLRKCLQSRTGDTVQSTASQRTDVDTRPQVTCHVLDTSLGCPAVNLPVSLLRSEDGSRAQDGVWAVLSKVITNTDGRGQGLSHGIKLSPGLYRVAFDTAKYYADSGIACPFYPQPVVDFIVTQDSVEEHFHIPLLISPFSYSTYRGS
eukprot:jgi/Ulvmu1/5127/UM021_0144.1